MFRQLGDKIAMGGKQLGQKIMAGGKWFGNKMWDHRKEIALGIISAAGAGLFGENVQGVTKATGAIARDPKGFAIGIAPQIGRTMMTSDPSRQLPRSNPNYGL